MLTGDDGVCLEWVIVHPQAVALATMNKIMLSCYGGVGSVNNCGG